MDEHSGISRANGSNHTKSYTATTHMFNGATQPVQPQPRMSYNVALTNPNKDIVMTK